MDAVYPQALFATPVSLSLVFVIAAIQVISVGFMAFAAMQFGKMVDRHTRFFEEIGDPASYAHIKSQLVAGKWIYIVLTIAVTVLASIIFLFQPHIF